MVTLFEVAVESEAVVEDDAFYWEALSVAPDNIGII